MVRIRRNPNHGLAILRIAIALVFISTGLQTPSISTVTLALADCLNDHADESLRG
jgi:hypothetical protein